MGFTSQKFSVLNYHELLEPMIRFDIYLLDFWKVRNCVQVVCNIAGTDAYLIHSSKIVVVNLTTRWCNEELTKRRIEQPYKEILVISPWIEQPADSSELTLQCLAVSL